MSYTKGKAVIIEDWLVTTLAALTADGSAVFNEVDNWRHQIGAGASGIESLERYAPCAFCAYTYADALRAGDYDLNQRLHFSILIAAESRSPGIARLGDDNHLGTSRIRDLVINAVDGTHPGAGYSCDELFYEGEREAIDHPRYHAVELHFGCNFFDI
jgi:hypothetical protein